MVVKKGVVDRIPVGLYDAAEVGEHFPGPRLVPAFPVVKKYPSVRRGMIEPHISIVYPVFVVPVEHLYRGFVYLEVFLPHDHHP